MKLEETVVDPKLALALRLAGLRQHSLYAWLQNSKGVKPLLRKMPAKKPINTSSAYTLTELKDILTKKGILQVRSDNVSNRVEWGQIDSIKVYETTDGYEVDAVAKMILELLKLGIKLN